MPALTMASSEQHASSSGNGALRKALLTSIALTAVLGHSSYAQTAQNPTNTTPVISAQKAASSPLIPSTSALNDVVVTGSRSGGQKARNSATPIDVIPGSALARTGQVDLRQALEQLSPSIAQEVYEAGNAGFKDNITLRGLSPNNVLVLVNGKRRHESAIITQNGGPQLGASGVDLDMIPVSAIDHIEILKDGDSAQYGSDAIGGVINIILKSADHGVTIGTTEGQYYAGDGFSRELSATAGTSLFGNGFLDLSGEYSGHDFTTRKYLDPRNNTYDTQDPNLTAQNRESLAYNGGYYFPDGIEVYSFSTYAHRNGSQQEDTRLGTLLPKIYPNGFRPIGIDTEDDYSFTGGVKGGNLLGWSWDLSTTYGADAVNYGDEHTGNVSYYDAFGYTPTTVHAFDLNTSEWTNNFDISRPFHVPVLAAPVNVSLGVEERREYFSDSAGDLGSIYGTGAQAGAGFSPDDVGSWSRNVVATYLDLGTHFNPNWQVDAAGRFEHYSDVGDTENGKLATRYNFTPKFALRGSFGTGFDAPSLAQEHITNLGVEPTEISGFLAPDSAVAKSLGASALKPEFSTNYSLGVVLDPLTNLHLTVDLYQIDIRDRIVDGGTASGTTAIAALEQAGFTISPTLTGGEVTTSYFTNGANTRTRGLDLVGSYQQDLSQFGAINWDMGGNINDTEITHATRQLNVQQLSWLTSSTPKFKIIVGGTWQLEKWGFTAHENIIGPTSDYVTYFAGPNAYSTTKFYRFVQSTKYTTNIALHYQATRQLQLTVGANNLFNIFPTLLPLNNRYEGAKYDGASSQLGQYGGFYYVNAILKF